MSFDFDSFYYIDENFYKLIEDYPLKEKLEFMEKYYITDHRIAPRDYKSWACLYSFSDKEDADCIACLYCRYCV